MKIRNLVNFKNILIFALLITLCITCVACKGNPDTTSSDEVSEDESSRLVISCWGDSLTEGMGVSGRQAYPAVLNEYLGTDKYTVLNGGDGGEDSITIMARQGGVKVYTCDKIIFNEGDVEVKIGDGSCNGLETENGEAIRLTPSLGRDMSVNDVTIGANKYQIVIKDFNWNARSCEVYLKRTTNINNTATIEKGTEAEFASASIPKTNHCDIYLMGGNGGYGKDVNTLIAQHKKMIEHRGNENYFVLIPYWTASNATDAFKEAFGNKAVDFLVSATNQEILENELQITLTDLDKQYVSLKRDVPPCLKLNNDKDQGHMNAKGYKLLAKVIYEQGKELGYWQ